MPAALRVETDLMGLLNVEAESHAPPQFVSRALSDLNASLQEIYSMAPTEWFGTNARGLQVRAPLNVTLTVTQYSHVITFAGYASWMLNCTIIVNGDSNQNKLVSLSAGIGLQLPYAGASGTVGATVYHDCVTMDSDTFQVTEPVMLNGTYELRPMATARDLRRSTLACGDYNWKGYGYGGYGGTGIGVIGYFQTKSISIPLLYLVDNVSTFNGTTVPGIVFDTLPDKAYVLSFIALMTAPRVTSFADTREYLVPFGYEETILYPMVRFRFSSWPPCTLVKDELKADYENAKKMLSGLNPQGFVETFTQMQR